MFGNKSAGYKILDLLLSVLALFSFLLISGPAVILLTIANQCFRWILILYMKMFRRDILRIMTGNNPVMAIDDIHTRPLCAVVCYGAFEGATAENLIQMAKNCVLDTDPKTNQFVYPEFQQYYVEDLGYVWWKEETNFEVERHIEIWHEGRDNRNPLLENDFMQIIATLVSKPFPRERSPWEVVIVENVLLENVKNPEVPKAAIIFRFQHGLADGLSFLQILMKCVFNDSMDKIPKPTLKQSNAAEKLSQLGSIFQLPYLFVKQFVCAMDFNEWHLSEAELSRRIYRAWTRRIPISVITKIKNQHSVSFTAVLINAVSGALRKMMIKENVKIPKRINALVPLHQPNHPNTLCNHWSFGFLELPTGQSDSLQRLHHVNTYFEGMKRSLLPAFNFIVLTLTNRFPTWWMKNIDITNRLPTVLLSNFPGPPPESTALGFNLVDAVFTGGLLRGNMGIHISIMSYDGAVRIVVGVDSSIFANQEMMDHLIDLIEKEFFEIPD